MVSEGVGQIPERFRVTRQIQEAKTNIRKWIKFRDKSEILPKKVLEERQTRREAGTSKKVPQRAK